MQSLKVTVHIQTLVLVLKDSRIGSAIIGLLSSYLTLPALTKLCLHLMLLISKNHLREIDNNSALGQ